MDVAMQPTPSPAPDRPLVAKAEEVFARVSPYEGFGFRHHCQRLYHFTTMLMRTEGVEFDSDLAYLIALVHDLGIVSEKDEGVNYLQRSCSLFHRESKGLPLPDVDPTTLDECLLYNHRLFPVPNVSPAADCFRRAVIIEHSHGLKRYGLPRDVVSEVFAAHPRGNFDRVLLDFAWRTIRREPMTLINGIFF